MTENISIVVQITRSLRYSEKYKNKVHLLNCSVTKLRDSLPADKQFNWEAAASYLKHMLFF